LAKPFIHVLRKSSGDYAAIYRPEWKNGKKVNNPINLGRVIDLNK
jgi:hypothetical protein